MKTGPLKCPKCNQDLYIKEVRYPISDRGTANISKFCTLKEFQPKKSNSCTLRNRLFRLAFSIIATG
jgi:hypothetical protein